MQRIPRKKKKQIPKHIPYCYTPLHPLGGNKIGYKIKSCPFYEHIHSTDGHCNLLNLEITDQIKDCGVSHY